MATDTSSPTPDGEMACCKTCGKPVIFVEDRSRWLHYVSGIGPCYVGGFEWAEPVERS